VSYSLRGRLDSRLAAAIGPLLVAVLLAALLRSWWPLQLAALMLAVGLVLDVLVYHRIIDYQPGWLAVPLGLLELAAVMVAARALDVPVPRGAALAFFAAAWVLAQVLGHAALPRWCLTYGDDGGELGRAGAAVALVPIVVLGGAGGTAYANQPPTVHLATGVHEGPLVLDHPQRLIGARGAIVRGGIVVAANNVLVSGVTVVGGENGIEVDGFRDVRLEHVRISGTGLDGIHVRASSVSIRGCAVDMTGSTYGQGIDISYTFDLPPSSVRGCTVVGGREGIVTHSANAMLRDNWVAGSTLRGIAMTEMSMGEVRSNEVSGVLGVGILCGDHSRCEISRNRVLDTRPDAASGDISRMGYGILAQYHAHVELGRNELVRSPGGVGSFLDSRINGR
jgi:hypothetical protein